MFNSFFSCGFLVLVHNLLVLVLMLITVNIFSGSILLVVLWVMRGLLDCNCLMVLVIISCKYDIALSISCGVFTFFN